MKKILGLTIAAVLVMGLVGGGTWAYFSDTETSSGNSFAAGTLDLGLDTDSGQDPTGSISSTFTASGWAPGETNNGTIYVNNEGSIDMTALTITFTHGSITDGTPTTVDDYDATNDTDNLTKMIKATTVTWGGSTESTLQGKTLEELQGLGAHSLGTLDANNEKALFIDWTFDSTATNGCQGDSIEVTISFAGSQS
jgi:predicted ribosomally synthesized peptide with SipW-like signal peptide